MVVVCWVLGLFGEVLLFGSLVSSMCMVSWVLLWMVRFGV